MYAVGTKYDTIPSPLVRFDHNFVLANAPPVPSHYNYSPYRAPTTTNEQETSNKKQCYIWCALRSDPQCDCQDFDSDCLSNMFTVGLYIYFNIFYNFSVHLFACRATHSFNRNEHSEQSRSKKTTPFLIDGVNVMKILDSIIQIDL
jgi:hypothetical protein